MESVLRTVKLIRANYDMPVLRTTMIVGFPQETEEDFQMLIDFIKEVRWDRLGAFTFSDEEDTPGASTSWMDRFPRKLWMNGWNA